MGNYEQALIKIKEVVREKLKNESCHDYWHVFRVVQMALQIGRQEKANLEVLELAGWLHDVTISSAKRDHDVEGAKFARNLLPRLGIEPEITEQVSQCISEHRFIKSKPASSLESQILQDADKLDTLGAVGIARIFSLAGEAGQLIHDPKVKPDFSYYLEHNQSNTSINHFYDKIFKLNELMHTNTAKKIADKREKYMKDYLERFFAEWEGKS